MMTIKKKRIVIVGNAPLKEDCSALVNEAELVVRFNHARNFGSKLVGSKTDVLCIANKEDPGRRASKYPTLKNLEFIGQVKAIWFPYFSELKASQFWIKPFSRARFKKTNYCNWILVRNDLTDKNVLHFGKAHYVSACNELKIMESNNLEPSSGYLAVKYIIEHYPAELFEIMVIGFTFTGSSAHSWPEEKANILAWSDNGLVKVL